MVETCPACGHVGDHDGPGHAYLSVSPACWARYGEVLAREYSDPAYWRTHRVLTDAYCGQHSIGADRRARQSLWIHMAALSMHFDDRAEDEVIVDFLGRAAKSDHPFPELAMPAENMSVRIDAVHAAPDAPSHRAAAVEYARAVHEVWAPHRAALRSLIAEVAA